MLEYQGNMAHTLNGLSCQRWDSLPSHLQREDSLFADGSASAASNHCRVFDDDIYNTLWCHTTLPSLQAFKCDYNFCRKILFNLS